MASRKTTGAPPGFEQARKRAAKRKTPPPLPSQTGTAASRKHEVQTFGAPSAAARRKAGTLTSPPPQTRGQKLSAAAKRLAGKASGALSKAESLRRRIPEAPDTGASLAAIEAAARGTGPATGRRTSRQAVRSRIRSGVRPTKKRRSTRQKR